MAINRLPKIKGVVGYAFFLLLFSQNYEKREYFGVHCLVFQDYYSLREGIQW